MPLRAIDDHFADLGRTLSAFSMRSTSSSNSLRGRCTSSPRTGDLVALRIDVDVADLQGAAVVGGHDRRVGRAVDVSEHRVDVGHELAEPVGLGDVVGAHLEADDRVDLAGFAVTMMMGTFEVARISWHTSMPDRRGASRRGAPRRDHRCATGRAW